MRPDYNITRRGFTLIELSIVLIILGFLTGGVLVGKELIYVAQLRSTLSQLEKFNTGSAPFQYNIANSGAQCSLAIKAGF